MVSATKCPAWDNTLLTVGEAKRNLRIRTTRCAPKSRRDEILSLCGVVPAGLRECVTFLARIRRLRFASPPVNKVSSLRDFAFLNIKSNINSNQKIEKFIYLSICQCVTPEF